MRDVELARAAQFDPSGQASVSRVSWKKLSDVNETKVTRARVDRSEARVDNFSELRSQWHQIAGNQQQIITDMLASGEEFVYVCGIKPIAITRLNTNTNESISIDVSELFQSAWRAYYPRLRLARLPDNPASALLYEETGDLLFKIDFDSLQIHTPERSIVHRGAGLMTQAKKAIGKYFADQTSLYRVVPLNSSILARFQSGSDQIVLNDLTAGLEVAVSLGSERDSDVRVRISQVTPLGADRLLVAFYNGARSTKSDDVGPQDLQYLVLAFPASFKNQPDDFRSKFELFYLNESLLGK